METQEQQATLLHLQRLRRLMTIYTVILLIFLILDLGFDFDFSFLNPWGLPSYYWILLKFIPGFYAVWFIWKKMPVRQSRKWSESFFVLFLNIIGLWIWIPSQKRMKQLLIRANSPYFEKR